MPDLDQIKQGEQDPRGRFARGRSGNPLGWPRGRLPRSPMQFTIAGCRTAAAALEVDRIDGEFKLMHYRSVDQMAD
jgi:hypothetical protein